MIKLNEEMIKALFDREAVYIGRADVVPDWRVIQLFGEAAVDFSKRMAPENFNGYGIGDYTEFYLTIRGFQLAATYHNITITREERRAIYSSGEQQKT